MNIPYTYEVIQSSAQGMTLRYNSPGRAPVTMGTHAPTPGESVDAIAWQYSPVAMWAAQDAVRVVVPVGTTGAFTPPVVPPVTLASVKAEKLAEIAAWRYEREVGGVNFMGARIKTDRESQATVNSAFVSLSQGLVTGIDWKAEGGQWVRLTLPEVTAIATAVASHVQLSFSLEKQYADLVAAATSIAAVRAIVPESP